MMTKKRMGVGVVVFAGGYDRVHYALAMAAAAAATGRRVSVLVTGRALPALLAEPGWQGLDAADDHTAPAERDRLFAARGIATFEELLSSCAALGVTFTACEMGLRALGLPADAPLRPELAVTIGGLVGFLDDTEGDRILFV